MDYDVFISYSRKDTAIADRVCAAFDRAGITYFIDRQGIGGAVEFPDEIARAIKGCRKMLFLASRNAYASKYTKREIFFAFNEKNDSDIIPYVLDGCDMPDSLRFVFSTTNIRNMREHPVETVLVDDILRLLGRDPLPVRMEATVRPERWRGLRLPHARPVVAILVATVAVTGYIFGYGAIGHSRSGAAATLENTVKSYEIGDYYNENGREGVVFEVDDSGRHGKIVGMSHSYEQWCTDAEFKKRTSTGAVDMADGAHNMRIVSGIDGWREKYPAFGWCAKQGDGWYPPAIKELEMIMYDSVYDAVNRTLTERGGNILVDKGIGQLYWSSTEHDAEEWCAWTASMNVAGIKYYRKNLYNYVRAVSAF